MKFQIYTSSNITRSNKLNPQKSIYNASKTVHTSSITTGSLTQNSCHEYQIITSLNQLTCNSSHPSFSSMVDNLNLNDRTAVNRAFFIFLMDPDLDTLKPPLPLPLFR